MPQTPNRLALVCATTTVTKSNTVAGSVKNNNKPQNTTFPHLFHIVLKVGYFLFCMKEGAFLWYILLDMTCGVKSWNLRLVSLL